MGCFSDTEMKTNEAGSSTVVREAASAMKTTELYNGTVSLLRKRVVLYTVVRAQVEIEVTEQIF